MIERLFDRLGGAAELGAAVNLLYERLAADDRLSHFFDGDMRRMKRHQRGFLTVAVGGEDAYYGLDLMKLHRPLGVNGAQFAIMVNHLREVLAELMVEESDIADVMEMVARLKPQIVQNALA